jgi:hypothetical protein
MGAKKFLRNFGTCSQKYTFQETGIVIVTAMIAPNITDFIVTPNVRDIIP